MSLSETLRLQPRWLVLLEALILVGLIGWADYLTGWEWNFFAPYAVPIVLVTWKTGWRWGFGCAVLCALSFWVTHVASNPYQTGWGFALSVFGRWFYFSVLVVAVAALKDKREFDRARIATLERAEQLERQLVQTSEREQQRIGRDLHDGLAPHLAAIRYAATFLANDLRRRAQPETAQADKIGEMTADAVALARDLARGILPVQTDAAGLAFALKELANTTSRQAGMAVSFYATGDFEGPAPDDGMHLYRIAQEALTNARKHGGATRVTMVLSRSADALRLVIADDGNGMPPSPTGPRGMGLDSMRYRARVLGGELKIESRPDEGTVVSCEIPLRRPRPATPAS